METITNSNSGILYDLAVKVMGGEHVLSLYIERRKQKAMPRHFLRQMFLVKTKEVVGTFSPCRLGEICVLGKDFNVDHEDNENFYRDATLVAGKGSGWSGVGLNDYDSGLVLLQKIAVASILITIIQLVSDGQQDLGMEGWEPWEFHAEDWDYQKVIARERAITEHLGW
jgi:hypothetical protein